METRQKLEEIKQDLDQLMETTTDQVNDLVQQTKTNVVAINHESAQLRDNIGKVTHSFDIAFGWIRGSPIVSWIKTGIMASILFFLIIQRARFSIFFIY